MSIEVHVNTSVNPLRTCIEVLSEHIQCTKVIIFFELSFCVLVSVSLAYFVYLLSFH